MANFIESRSAFVQDITERGNIVYQAADSTLWYARAQEWADAQVLPDDD
ncbi:MAG: hypothetical protein AAFW95_12615 [Cyanobacteria bacterium J06638_6]